MKIKNIVLSLIIFSIFGITLSFIPVWGWFFDFFNLDQSHASQLLVTTPKSGASIFIDGNLKGKTVADKELTISNVSKGNHNVRIERNSNPTNFYVPFEKNINFVPSTAVQVIWSAGPSVESSSGVVKYFNKQVDSSFAKLKVSVFPTDAAISIDDKYSSGEITIDDIKAHKVSVNEKLYFGQDVSVQMTKSNGERIVGYDLIVEVYLYKNPIPEV